MTLTRRHALALALAAASLPAAGRAQGAREVVEMSIGSPDAPGSKRK